MYQVAKGFCLVLIAWLQLDTQQNPTDIGLAEVTVRIAQLVERWSNKPLVLGSIPNVNTLFFFFLLFFLFFVLEGRHTVYIKKNAFGTFVGVCNGAL